MEPLNEGRLTPIEWAESYLYLSKSKFVANQVQRNLLDGSVYVTYIGKRQEGISTAIAVNALYEACYNGRREIMIISSNRNCLQFLKKKIVDLLYEEGNYQKGLPLLYKVRITSDECRITSEPSNYVSTINFHSSSSFLLLCFLFLT